MLPPRFKIFGATSGANSLALENRIAIGAARGTSLCRRSVASYAT